MNRKSLIIILILLSQFVNGQEAIQIKATEDILADKSLTELRFMRNEIFARHGYIFKSEDLNAYFSDKSWYSPIRSDVTKLLTEIDKYNIQLIKKKEQELDIQLTSEFEIIDDKVKIPEFSIEIVLSEKAELKLKNDSETIIVKAFFSGEAKDKTLEEFGEFYIGTHEIELIDTRKADFKNVLVSKNAFDQLICKDFLVLINVYSGRKSSDLNLISCNILQKDISQVKSRNHILKGRLIEEY